MYSIFNDVVLFLFIPLFLLGILRELYVLIQEDEDSSRQMMAMLSAVMGASLMLILAILNSQVLDIRYLSFDPFAYLLPQSILILLLILLSAFFTFLILSFIDSLNRNRQQPYAAAIYGAAFIFLIYLGYFNLALKSLATLSIFGVMLGVGLNIIVRRFRNDKV